MSVKFKNGIDVNSQKITSVADPATTTDAATKNYVDTQDALDAKLASANTFTAGPQTVNINAASNKGVVVRAATSQTANLQEWQDSSGTAMTKINATGGFAPTANTVSADGTRSGASIVLDPTSNPAASTNGSTRSAGIITTNGTNQRSVMRTQQTNSGGSWPTSYDIIIGDEFSALNATTKIYAGTTGYIVIGNAVHMPYLAITGATTLSAIHYTVDCTGGPYNVTLPTAVGITGRIYNIKNSGTGTITIATTSSQTIDGASTITMDGSVKRYQTITVQSNGSNWIII
jgi:hypothetical protein